MSLRPACLALFLACALAWPLSSQSAVSPRTDHSDLWWSSAESGWGAHLFQQDKILFMALFVYGADGKATWFVAPALGLAEEGERSSRWQGGLFATTGPAFAGNFNPANVANAPVGSAGIVFDTPVSGTLTYSVNGVTITKAITRQTWRDRSFGGTYYGGHTTLSESCSDEYFKGSFDLVGNMVATRTGTAMSFVTTSLDVGQYGQYGIDQSPRCTIRGTYRQDGKYGSIQGGTINCSLYVGLDDRGENIRNVTRLGTVNLDRIELNASGFSGNVEIVDQFCRSKGYFGGTGALLPQTSATPSGLWWNAAESGWGAGFTVQADVGFLTIFVYGADNKPTFFVAPDLRAQGAGGASIPTFAGALYRTSGPGYAAGAFDPAAVTAQVVGAAEMRFSDEFNGTLTYTVDGVPVTKAIKRQTWSALTLEGDYKGGLFAAAENCTSGFGGTSIAYPGSVKVKQTGLAVEMESLFDPGWADGGQCVHRGTLRYEGRLASITGGSYQCEFDNGPLPVSGTFDMADIELSPSGFQGRYLGREGASCLHRGQFGGVRRGYNDLGLAPDEFGPITEED